MNSTKHVLVVAHADGYIEVFADKGIRCRFVNICQMPTVEGEILAERYLEESLPKPFKDIYFPGNRIVTGNVLQLTPELLAKREFEVDVVRACNAVQLINSDTTTSQEVAVWL